MKRKPYVAIYYRNSKNLPTKGPYHVGGLSSNALHSVAVLKKLGIEAELFVVKDHAELLLSLKKNKTPTHVILEAIWVSAKQLEDLAWKYPDTKFVVRSHSKMGFLQVEPESIPTIRDIVKLQRIHVLRNVFFAANNQEFAHSLSEVYGKCLYLPNLYELVQVSKEKPPSEHLKIASFGASRLLKLHPNAALAALQIAKKQRKPLKFYINQDNTPGGESVRKTIRNMFAGLDWAELVEIGWQDPHIFRKTISEMDLVFQLSATETFNHVAADAVVEGVPIVVSEAIDWVNPFFQAIQDDTSDAAYLGNLVLNWPKLTNWVQLRKLRGFVFDAETVWLKFLKRSH